MKFATDDFHLKWGLSLVNPSSTHIFSLWNLLVPCYCLFLPRLRTWIPSPG